MKVVVNAYSAKLGGGKTYLYNIFSYLPVVTDLEVFVFGSDDLEIAPHPCIRFVDTKWPTTNPIMRVFWEKFLLPKFLDKNDIDVLFCPGGVVNTKVPKKCRVVTMFRNMMPFDENLISGMRWGLQKFRNILLRRAFLKSMSSADLTIFISNYARELIENLIVVPKAITIPHGVGDIFRSYGQKLPRPDKAPITDYILYVSRFDIYKHHEMVVEAFSMLPHDILNDVDMVFLGETNLPEAKKVQKKIHEYGLNNKIHINGAIPYKELPAWYSNARLIVFASSCENCPNILLESLGAGRPILCSDVMPMPEFGGVGLKYFSLNDVDDLVKSFEMVLYSDIEANKIAKAALERSFVYDWRYTAEKTWNHIFSMA